MLKISVGMVHTEDAKKKECPVQLGLFLKNWKRRINEFSSFLHIYFFLKRGPGYRDSSQNLPLEISQMSQLVGH